MNINDNKIIEKNFQEIEKDIEIENKFKPAHISELMKKEFKNTEWLVEKLVPTESIVAVSGSPATYKTWIVLDLAIKVSQGNVLFDKFITSQAGVLIIDEENGERLLQNRFRMLNKNFDLPIYFLSLTNFKLSGEKIKEIIKFCQQKAIKLVIFDSLIRIHSEDENDAGKMARVFGFLKQLNKKGLTIVFTHHNRKQGFLKSHNPSQDMRGSSDILASLDSHLAIEKKDDHITVNQTKLRQDQEIKPFKLSIVNSNDEFRFEYFGEVDKVHVKKEELVKKAIKDILSKENKPMYKREIFEAIIKNGLDIGYSTFDNSTKEMVEKEELFQKRGEKNKIYLSLSKII